MKSFIDLLFSLGVSPHYKGYSQLAYILHVVSQDEMKVSKMYAKAAEYFDCSPKSIESNICTLAERAWTINPSLLCEIMNKELHSAPSPAQFLKSLCSYIRCE